MVLEILTDRTYRHLILAQIVALPGTGLATVALGPLAYDLSSDGAAMVLGTVFSLKMLAYVGVAPVATAFAERLNRRRLLIALDLVRVFCALALPFVTEVWHVYLLIFALQSASAGVTPTFQATIPDLLRDEAQYARALALSRLAYDVENIVSPLLAAQALADWSALAAFRLCKFHDLSAVRLADNRLRRSDGVLWDRGGFGGHCGGSLAVAARAAVRIGTHPR